jgi:predicted phage replisome organizer
MANDVKWIKITTNMFDDEKIKLIESMPDKDAILIIWIKLLVQAGRTNANGYIFLNEKIPYTEEMLATIFNRPINTVRLALKTFKEFNMIEMDEKGLLVTNWNKHQDEKRNRVTKKYREWRNSVFKRDRYACQSCGAKGARIEAHHIKPWATSVDKRFEVENGLTLCVKCHRRVHKKAGD